MSMDKIGAIIIVKDPNTAKQVSSVLPDYIESVCVKPDDAKEKLFTGINGAKAKLVIIDADDKTDKALALCKYLYEDPNKQGFRKVAIVLLTVDEFSNSSMEFLEYGDPVFYTGEINDSDFYMVVTDALEEAELREDDPYELPEEDSLVQKPKSPDKIMGMTFEMDNPELMRVVSYSDEAVKESLNGLVNKNKEYAMEVFSVLEETSSELEEAGIPVEFKYGAKKERTVRKVEHPTEKTETGSEPANGITSASKWGKGSDSTKAIKASWGPKWGGKNSASEKAPAEDISSLHKLNDAAKVDELLEEDDMLSFILNLDPQAGSGNTAGVQTGTQLGATMLPNVNLAGEAKKVLIVDSDATTEKAFKLFLGAGYEFYQVDSSMKAIDYVVKNKVDIVAVDYDMNGMSGKAILSSILNQPNGFAIKAFLIMNEKSSKEQINDALLTIGVSGVITKPIVKKQLVGAINRAYTTI